MPCYDAINPFDDDVVADLKTGASLMCKMLQEKITLWPTVQISIEELQWFISHRQIDAVLDSGHSYSKYGRNKNEEAVEKAKADIVHAQKILDIVKSNEGN
jgi:hypothetical protein